MNETATSRTTGDEDVPGQSAIASTSGAQDRHVQINGDAPIRQVQPPRVIARPPSPDNGSSGCCCFSKRPNNVPKITPPPPQSPSREIIRLLMVGKGDVGKSTIIKQLQNLCNDNPNKYAMYDETWTNRIQTFTVAQRKTEKQQVLRNILHCIGTLLEKVEDFGYSYDSPENEAIAQRLSEQIGDVDSVLRRTVVEVPPEMGADIAALWKDKGVQEAWKRRREYNISDHATEYFFEPARLQKVVAPDYIPTADDIIRARNPTRDTRDYNFEIEGTKFSFRDMGGQPVEIRRWPIFVSNWLSECEDSTRKYILFVASLADYNQRLADRPPKYTQLVESIRLMQILMNIDTLHNTGFILFLNKRDTLERKLLQFNDFAEHFPQAQPQHHTSRHHSHKVRKPPPPPKPEEAESIIGASFHSAAQETLRRDRPLYMHFTCATDKAQMDGIIGAVRVDILFKYMQTGIPFP